MKSLSRKTLFIALRTPLSYRLFEELGIGYLAAFMRERGYEVMLLEEDEEKIDIEEIKKYDPLIVGFPVYLTNETAVYNICRKLKDAMPGIYICLGGYSPTYRGPQMMRESSDVDFIVRGEGEQVWLDLMTRLNNGGDFRKVKGLIFREDGEIIENERQELIKNIDALPWPARDYLEKKKYNIALITSSRGCSGNCSFCVTRNFWRKWRGRDIRDVVDEIEQIKNRYGINVFHFIDCSFENPGICYERVWNIAEEIVRRNLDIFYFSFMRADFQRKADSKLMELLKKSGMIGALVGIESSNEETLKLYNKHTKPEDNYRVVELFRDYDIYVDIGFIMFNPYSTFDGLRENIDFLEKYQFASIIGYVAGLYAMFEGCALREKIKADSLLLNNGDDPIRGYKFADERVGKLAMYVISYVQSVERETLAAFLRIHKSFTTLGYWKRIYAGNVGLYQTILDTEIDYSNYRKELNRNISTWFRQLINCAENGWDEKAADEITERHLSIERILKLIKSLEHRKTIFHTKLTRQGFDIHNAPFIERV